jgi:hypothetical protein
LSGRQEATRERADIAFALYQQMGDQRSLGRLDQQLRALGVRISLATLKRWSARSRWQERVARLNSEAVQQLQSRGVQHVLAMYERHAQLARAVQGAGGTVLHKLMVNDRRLSEMRPSEIARLLDLGVRAERQAFSESTDRHEMALSIWNTVTTEIVELFNKVSSEPEPEARARLFARGLANIVDRHLAAVKDES